LVAYRGDDAEPQEQRHEKNLRDAADVDDVHGPAPLWNLRYSIYDLRAVGGIRPAGEALDFTDVSTRF
jgi:hypothetical protein